MFFQEIALHLLLIKKNNGMRSFFIFVFAFNSIVLFGQIQFKNSTKSSVWIAKAWYQDGDSFYEGFMSRGWYFVLPGQTLDLELSLTKEVESVYLSIQDDKSQTLSNADFRIIVKPGAALRDANLERTLIQNSGSKWEEFQEYFVSKKDFVNGWFTIEYPAKINSTSQLFFSKDQVLREFDLNSSRFEFDGASIASTSVFFGDLDSDGIDESIVYYSLAPAEGGNALLGCGFVVYSIKQNKIIETATFQPNFQFYIEEIEKLKIHIVKEEYGFEDGPGRPSIRTSYFFILNGNKIQQSKAY